MRLLILPCCQEAVAVFEVERSIAGLQQRHWLLSHNSYIALSSISTAKLWALWPKEISPVTIKCWKNWEVCIQNETTLQPFLPSDGLADKITANQEAVLALFTRALIKQQAKLWQLSMCVTTRLFQPLEKESHGEIDNKDRSISSPAMTTSRKFNRRYQFSALAQARLSPSTRLVSFADTNYGSSWSFWEGAPA